MSLIEEPNSISKTVKALYIHVPFCQSKCHYCDFYSIAGADFAKMHFWHETVLLELKRIYREAEVNGVAIKPLDSIYFGGGTPSLLETDFLEEELRLCEQLFGISSDAEITLEANPEQIKDKSSALEWHLAGINRLSIGVQSASDRLLRVMGRRHSKDDARRAIMFAHEAGFENISADLISGLPDGHLSDIDESLNLLDDLPLRHVSCYALDVAPDTYFATLLREEGERFPDDEAEREMFYRVRDHLLSRGFEHYEISNFALPGYRSRHNLVYWHAEPYLAAGPAASSYMAGIRRTNPASLTAWQRLVNTGGPYSDSTISEIVTEKEAMKESMLLGLRLLDGISAREFYLRHGQDYRIIFKPEIEKLIRLNLLVYRGDALCLTRKAEDVCNIVFREFI